MSQFGMRTHNPRPGLYLVCSPDGGVMYTICDTRRFGGGLGAHTSKGLPWNVLQDDQLIGQYSSLAGAMECVQLHTAGRRY
jgi:hypothetical protein